MIVYIEKYYPKARSPPININQPIMTPNQTRKTLLDINIPPFSTYTLVFHFSSKNETHGSHRITFITKDNQSPHFSFDYQYNVIQGKLDLLPTVIKYSPSFPGIT